MTTVNKLATLPIKAIHVLREEGTMRFLRRFGMLCHARVHRLLQKTRKIRCETKLQAEWPPEKPLISVIIPCYNYGTFLRGAIESVLDQTYQRFEILVINDGSTDDFTRQLLRDLSYPKTTVIHQENRGWHRPETTEPQRPLANISAFSTQMISSSQPIWKRHCLFWRVMRVWEAVTVGSAVLAIAIRYGRPPIWIHILLKAMYDRLLP